jgi:prephenate dehydrogenase
VTLPRTVAIIGLGLIGGSLARDLRRRGVEVLAFDSSGEVVDIALGEGIAARRLPPDLAGLEEADLVVLAVPVDGAPRVLEQVAGRLGSEAVITDVGSVKRSIARRAEELGLAQRFVGGHPLAGDHRSGWSAAREGLFAGAPVFLCPTHLTSARAVERVRALWTELGSRPELVTPEEHDRRMATISHLPQIVSTALAAEVAAAGMTRAELGPGGRDVARLAASSPSMWTAICLESPDTIDAAVAALQERLTALRAALQAADGEAIRTFFEDGRRLPD